MVVPGFGLGYELIMPESLMAWVMAQPDSSISVNQAFLDINKTKYSLGHTRYWGDTWQFALVKTQLNAVLQYLIPGLNDELKLSFDTYFGKDTENWKEIELEKVLRNVIAQAASRFIVGAPLCRNETYLKANYGVIEGMMINAIFTNSSPKWLQPIIGPLVSRKSINNCEIVKKEFEPLFRERLETLKHDKDDPNFEEPQDHLQLLLRYAVKERKTELRDLDIIAKRIIAVNFASMNQTTMTVVNMLLNILGSDAEFNTIAVLREEMKRTTADGEPWTKAKLATMIRTDSVVRETLRINPFGNRSLMRKVIKDGLVTPDGMKLPKNSLFSFFSEPVQHDPDKFEDPFKYDPFRTSREREAAADEDGKPGGHALTVVSTSPNYLPWGHGKHACPGRFLVDLELKMLLTYLLTNYDIEFPAEYKGQRPPTIWLAEVGLPPRGAKIRVKRRKEAL